MASLNMFWTINNNKVQIIPYQLKKFLESEGFYKLKISNKQYILVRITNNVVEEVGEQYIKDHIASLLEKKKKIQVLGHLMSAANVYLGKNLFDFLDSKEITYRRDTKDKAFFYFKNGFVEVTGRNIKFRPYSDLKGYIWKDSIIPKDIKIDPSKPAEFDTFLLNISGRDKNRYESIRSIIAYLIHTYKDPTVAKAVIFLDEKVGKNGEAHGGTGKSLVGKALASIRDIVMIDGKSFRFDKSFAFQQVNLSSEIVSFDDVRKDFNFESLYSIITNGMDVEKKNQTTFHIPPDQSPKILISTNSLVVGTGGYTDERRRLEFEFADYYGEHRSPYDEFGHRLFDDWTPEEWNCFYNSILLMMQNYLSKGIIRPPKINIANKKLVQKTSEEFVEFADSELTGQITSQKSKFVVQDLLKTYNENYRKDVSTQCFKSWLEFWAKERGIEYDNSFPRSNDKTFFVCWKLQSETTEGKDR